MTGNILELERFLPYRLNRLADLVSRDFSRLYRERHGLTRPEWRLLATLGQFGAMTATAVGAHSAMHKTRVSRAVSALEARGWVERRADTADRRLEHLSLTRAGKSAYGGLVPLAQSFEAALLDRLNAQERRAVDLALAALERIAPQGG